RDRLARLRAAENSDHAGLRDARGLNACFAQFVCDELSGSIFFEAELRVPVDFAPPPDDVGDHCIGRRTAHASSGSRVARPSAMTCSTSATAFGTSSERFTQPSFVMRMSSSIRTPIPRKRA